MSKTKQALLVEGLPDDNTRKLSEMYLEQFAKEADHDLFDLTSCVCAQSLRLSRLRPPTSPERACCMDNQASRRLQTQPMDDRCAVVRHGGSA